MEKDTCDTINSNNNNSKRKEVLEGYVVDLACIRTTPYNDLQKFSREHSVNCGLMGHCVESGYGLIDDEGKIQILDSKATSEVVSILENNRNNKKGIKSHVEREMENGRIHTTNVIEIPLQ
jgi:hypothetical protein